MVATQKQYFNDAQLYPLYLMPRDMVAECGRGTGKGLIDAVRLLQCAQHMPGSNTSFVSPSCLCTWSGGATSVTCTIP